jgi:hypothetical protein
MCQLNMDNTIVPSTITAYRIFLATPGGLDTERQKFRDIVNSYNDIDALEKEVLFIPVGWELTLAGVGRPQALINEDLKRCDFFVLVLWNRWGSPPAKGGPFTSGTEEEYTLACTLLADAAQPMRKIIVFFKTVDAVQLGDPGPQLQKVIDFKKKVEEEKERLFSTFDDVEAFTKHLHVHLAAWMREHEKGLLKKPK